MTPVRWSPLQDRDAMERRMQRFFEGMGISPAVLPAADVYETDREYAIELEVPGFDEEQLLIEVGDHMLTIKGERTETKEEKEKAFRLHERLAKAFERRFELPHEADPQQVAADFKKGILTVRAPKTKSAKPRKIAIGSKS